MDDNGINLRDILVSAGLLVLAAILCLAISGQW